MILKSLSFQRVKKLAKKPKIILSQKEQITKIVHDHLASQLSIKDTAKLIWINVRHKKVGGMRLTSDGLRILDEELELKKYLIKFPADLIITNQIIIWLDQFIDGPYYLEKNSLIVFKEKTAIQLILFGGDIQKYGKSKALIVARERSVTV